jgi:(p)ppGpp synthase/HD superfamily hydrolase
MNAEKILIKTLLGDTEYRSVLFDVEPGMLPRGITTPGNVRFKVEDMTMFEEVYDAYMEEMKMPLTAMAVKMNKNKMISITMTLKVQSREQLDNAIKKLQKRSDVAEAYRSPN